MSRGRHLAPTKGRSRRVLVILTAMTVLMLAIPIAGAAPVEKTDVCHVTGASDVTNGLGNPSRTWAWGILLSQPEGGVAAHVAHGDNDGSVLQFFTEETHPSGWANLHDAAANRDYLTISSQVDCFFEVFSS